MKKSFLKKWALWTILSALPCQAQAFWDKIFSFFQVSKVQKEDPSLADKKYFLQQNVLPLEFNGEKGFQCAFGPKEAPCTLVIYTSQACHGCAHVHTQYLPRLLEKEYVKKGLLRIIVRDYPADPLSLYASALAWQFPDQIHSIQDALFESVLSSTSWVPDQDHPKTLEDALEKVRKIIKKTIHKDLQDSKPSDRLIKSIFAIKMRDKDGLNVQATPYFFLHQKDKPLQTLESDIGVHLFFKWLEEHLTH